MLQKEKKAMEIPREPSPEGTNPAVCPWCDAPIETDSELEDGRYDCEACSKPFDLTVDRQVTYVTKKVQDSENEGGD